MIKILVFPVGDRAEVREIDGSLAAMQAIVGGYIEAVTLRTDATGTLSLICDEEGKIKGYPRNRYLADDSGAIHDMLVGQFFGTRCDLEGEAVDLTDQDIAYLRDRFDR